MHVTSRFSRPLFLVYVLCSLAAIFYLPYFIPTHPTASDSYLFGYNNRAGLILLLISVAVGAAWTSGFNLQFSPKGKSRPVSPTTLAVSLLTVGFGCAVMYTLAARYGGTYETVYDVDRGWLLSTGKLPYVDFEWPFGIALLYGPLVLQHLFHLSAVHPYYFLWLLNWLLGTLLLYAVVNMVDYPTNSRRSIFLVVLATGFPFIILMSNHYALWRFISPLFFVLVVHKLLQRTADRSHIYAALVAVAFVIALLTVSPETAIAFAFATICMFVLATPPWDSRARATFAGLLLAFAAVFLAALKLHVLDTVRASGGGADSFPIIPAPHILLFFMAIFCCACYLFQRFTQNRLNDNTIGLLAYSLPMLAAALGRCDPPHTLLNGEGIFIASMFYMSNQKLAWKWYVAAMLFILGILPARYELSLLRKPLKDYIADPANNSASTGPANFLLHRALSNLARPAARAKAPKTRASAALAPPDKLDLAELYPTAHGHFLAPFGYKPNSVASYLSSEIDYGHFEAFENANTAAAVNAKLAELKNQPDTPLLLPGNFSRSTCTVSSQYEKQVIGLLFSVPYFRTAVHPDDVRQPVCNYISDNYQLEAPPDDRNFGYGLWVQNSAKASTTTGSRQVIN